MESTKVISFPCKIFSDKSVDIEFAKKSIRRRDCKSEDGLIVEKILKGINEKSNKAKIINILVPIGLYAEINFLINKANNALFDSYKLSIEELKSDSTLFDPSCCFASSIRSEEGILEGLMFVSHVGSVHRNINFDAKSNTLRPNITLQKPRYLTISHTDFFKLDNFKNRIFALLQSSNFDCYAPLYSFHLNDFLHQNNISGCISFVSSNEYDHFSLLVHPENVTEIKITEIIDDFSPRLAKQDFISNLSLLSKVSYEIDSYFIDKAHLIAGRSS